MPNETQQSQQFEHTMTTMFTCRSVIKYNSLLNEEQKQELILDIDRSLQFLRSSFVSAFPPEARNETVAAPPATQALMRPASQEKGKEDAQETLHALYRMYHSYLDRRQEKSIGAFVVRFNGVTAALSEIRSTLEQYQAPNVASLSPLDAVSGFIADLYYTFVEFMRTLSEVLEANDVHVDTEKLPSKQEGIEREARSRSNRLALLLSVYEAQKSLDDRYGPVTQRLQETRAFLAFLEETICSDRGEHERFSYQLAYLSRLLSDLVTLVTEYERATILLLS